MRYAGAGHPAAILFAGPNEREISHSLLESSGPIIGCGCGVGFDTSETTLPEYARMYVFSDGTFEIQMRGGRMWTHEELTDFLETHQSGGTPMDDALAHFVEIHGSQTLDDDCSILQCDF
jgi:sigma-B regulation protein RsbU (phosphoserine phosphatase)